MWHDPRAMNALSLTLSILSLAALLWAAGNWLVRQPSFAFQQVVVHNIDRADAAHVAAVIRHELKGTFFTMNLDNARRALQQVPWVRNAGLQRQWPDRLEVTIEEYKPFAHWNAKSLVTHDGVVFDAPYDAELPELAGNDGEAIEVIDRFETWSGWLVPLGLDLRAVRHSARGSWQVAVDKMADKSIERTADRDDVSGGDKGNNDKAQLIELGRDNVDARMERFVALYKKTVGALARAGMKPGYIDLRYQNGMAVRVVDLPSAGKESGKRAGGGKGGNSGSGNSRTNRGISVKKAGTSGQKTGPNGGQPRR